MSVSFSCFDMNTAVFVQSLLEWSDERMPPLDRDARVAISNVIGSLVRTIEQLKLQYTAATDVKSSQKDDAETASQLPSSFDAGDEGTIHSKLPPDFTERMTEFLAAFPSVISTPAFKLIGDMVLRGIPEGIGAPAMYDDTDHPNEASSESSAERSPSEVEEAHLCKIRLVWERLEENNPRTWVSAVLTKHYFQFIYGGMPKYDSFEPDQFGTKELTQMGSNFISHLTGRLKTSTAKPTDAELSPLATYMRDI